MSFPGIILLVLGIVCSIIGLIAKLLFAEWIDGASLLLVGVLAVMFSIGGFAVNGNKQSKKQKIFDWMFLFLLLVGGILSYLRKW